MRSLLPLACRGRARRMGPGGLGAGRRRRSFLLRGLERVEASLDRAHTAVEWIDRAQLRRDVVEPLTQTIHRPSDDATRDVDKASEGVLAHVSEFRDDVLVLGRPRRPCHAETIARSMRAFSASSCANGCDTGRRGGSGACGRRGADRVSGGGRGRGGRPCPRAFRLMALVAAAPRAPGRASLCLPARPSASGTTVSRRRADRLAWPLARRSLARERRSRRSFAWRADRG